MMFDNPEADEMSIMTEYSVASSYGESCDDPESESVSKAALFIVETNSTHCTTETEITKNTEGRITRPPRRINGARMGDDRIGVELPLSPLSCDRNMERSRMEGELRLLLPAKIPKGFSPLHALIRDIEDLLFGQETLHKIKPGPRKMSFPWKRQDPFIKRVDRINCHIIQQQNLLRFAPEDATRDFSTALCRVAIFNAEIECQNAKLELEKIEQEIKCTDVNIENHTKTSRDREFYRRTSMLSWDSN